MKSFEKILEDYKLNILNEEEAPPTPAPPPPAPAPQDGEPQQQEMPDPKKVVDELEKESKKPWVDLAGVLSRAIEHKFSDIEIEQINKSLSGSLTLSDFVAVRESPNIRDKYDANIVSSAVTLFDIVDKIMNHNNMAEITPSEAR
jgi:hypothetical protein